ncbi:MAG: hypothetical protein J5685_04710 [Clostridiales bacterium]|nr:hypothetical protein [Clostridiales bacterium]
MKTLGKVVSVIITASVFTSFSVNVFGSNEVSLDVFTDDVMREKVAVHKVYISRI